MKMSKEKYNQLKADIAAVAEHFNIILTTYQEKWRMAYMYKLYTAVNENRSYNDEWFALTGNTRALPYTGRKYCHLYDEGLNDTHIKTALKKICNELLTEQTVPTNHK